MNMEDDTKGTPLEANGVYTQKVNGEHLEANNAEARCGKAGQQPGTPQFTLPIPPVLEVVGVKGITADIQWNQFVEGNENYRYKIIWWSGTDEEFAYSNSKNYKITNMKEGMTYCVKVALQDMNGSNVSPASNTEHIDTAPAAPIDIQVENFESSPDKAIMVFFKDINKGRKVTHEVRVDAMNEAEAEGIIVPTGNRKALIDGLIPGFTYSISVKSKEGENESDTTYYDVPIMTYPAIPEGIKITYEEVSKLRITWQRLKITPLHYEVHWEANGAKQVTSVTEEMFILDDIKLSTMYRFKVAAVNKAGRGSFSKEKFYQTDPAPPSNVTVCRNAVSPTSSFIVNYEDPDALMKTYEIFATDLTGEKVSEVKSNTHSAVLNDLPAGRLHYIYVVAVYKGQRSKRAYCTRKMIV